MPYQAPEAAAELASVGPVERACPVTNKAEPRGWDGVGGDLPIDIDQAPTPRMRRFMDIWVAELKRQRALMEAATCR